MKLHNVDGLIELRSRFLALRNPPGLYHVTRVALHTRSPREPGDDWNEFLHEGQPFEFSVDEAWGVRPHESTYFGARERLRDYTALAAAALGLFPIGTSPVIYHHRNACVDRNQWTLGIYRQSRCCPWSVAIDVRGTGEYAAFEFDPDMVLGAFLGETAALDEFLDRSGRSAPKYLYAAVATDLFAASAAVIDEHVHCLQDRPNRRADEMVRVLQAARSVIPVRRDELSNSEEPLDTSTSEQKAGLSPQPEQYSETGSPFVMTRLQAMIWEALDSRALNKKALADKILCSDPSRFYKSGGLKDLMQRGIVKNKRGVGYYRPDSPPPELCPKPAQVAPK